jgi:hypothetical protein
MTKKPGDETIQGTPDFGRATDAYDASKPVTGSRPVPKLAEAAPEVSQGAWRERVFTPRAVLTKEEILAGLESALRVTLASANHPRVAFDQVRKLWLPFLRQAVEQAGGDGVDAWLLTMFKPPGRSALDALFAELGPAVARLRSARDLAHFEEEALKAVEQVRSRLSAPKPRRLSFKQMERELEGKLEVDELLQVTFASDDELARRIAEIGGTMSQLRDQIKTMPGKQPDGMYANFVRLKAELRVLDGELRRRPKQGQDLPRDGQ